MIVHFLRLKNFPIFRQLQLEEALLRADDKNYCLINEGSPPAIVHGISSPLERQTKLPMLRRFSGGGTVVVDENTYFVTLICNEACSGIKIRPSDVMCFMKERLHPAFSNVPFALRENDFVIGEKKFAGNAQYLVKRRFLHHTTLLWDYDREKMSLLQMPTKRPNYRKDRSHEAFLCKLCDYFLSREQFDRKLEQALLRDVDLKPLSLDELTPILSRPHRKAVKWEGSC